MTKSKLVVQFAPFFVLLLTQANTLQTIKDKPVNSSCQEIERDALISFKAGLIDCKNRLSSWQGQDCCQWRGVTCSKKTTNVVRLDLRNTYLDEWGNPEPGYALTGEISSSLVSLAYLNYLDLSYNNFSNAKIPEFIGSFRELIYLNISATLFSGRIPPQLSNLSSVQYLDFSLMYNSYSKDIAWLAHLSFLKHLDLSYVNLSSVKNLEALDMLPQIQTLCLAYCGINDTVFSLSHGNLTGLVTLDLSQNKLSNPPFLNWFGNMTGLEYVDFSINNLNSYALGSMNSIKELFLGSNNIRDMKASSFSNLSNLIVLDFSSNLISGDIAELTKSLSAHSCTNLQVLDLSSNDLNGNLSSGLGNIINLRILMLAHNNLSGSIPSSIGMLTQLVVLDLRSNNFHGEITEKLFSKMENLKSLILSGNSLSLIVNANWIPPFRLTEASFSSCKIGPKFPQWLKWQTNTFTLAISNTGIDDDLPVWFWKVFNNTGYLDLSKNNLRGQLPESFEFMSATEILLHDNHFSGSIPRLPKSLYTINLSENTLSGSLSFNFEDAVQLRVLILRENSFTGSIPQALCKLHRLQVLDASKNSLTGNIPNCLNKNINSTRQAPFGFGSSPLSSISSSIRMLNLGHNNLSGRFPLFLKSCNNLIFLGLENNNFFGNIPTWIGKKLPFLRILSLKSNQFSGTIPSQLAELSELQVLDLGQNNFIGSIPSSLKSLKRMAWAPTFPQVGNKVILQSQILDLDPFYVESAPNQYTIEFGSLEVDTKGIEFEYGDGIKYWTSFDLSCNNLIGDIPEEIGLLFGLINLNLSINKLSGNIPVNIGSLLLLESLDLSNNELSGVIPSNLSSLTFLSGLNLSYNNLSGRIPTGHQLQVLDDPSIYEGNPGLCGFPLSIECTHNNMNQPNVSNKETSDAMISFNVGAIIGILMGSCVVCGVLLWNESWRMKCFQCFDNLHDRLYVFVFANLHFLNWVKVIERNR
jgi:Leucine-rich repeat (LRR) protein